MRSKRSAGPAAYTLFGFIKSLSSLAEIAILRDAVGPRNKTSRSGADVWVRCSVASRSATSRKCGWRRLFRFRVKASVLVRGIKPAKRLVQRGGGSGGAVRERSDHFYSQEVICFAGLIRSVERGGTITLVARVAEVRAACNIGQGPVDNQTALAGGTAAGAPCLQCRWISPTRRNWPASWAKAPH